MRLKLYASRLDAFGWPGRSVVIGRVYYARTNDGKKPHLFCWGGEWSCFLFGRCVGLGRTIQEAWEAYERVLQ